MRDHPLTPTVPHGSCNARLTEDHGRISNANSISERPALADERALPGHWEGDLIFGTNNSQIVTLVEPNTRYVTMAKVKDKDTETVTKLLTKHAHKLRRELYKCLTWNRGKEVADFQRVAHTILFKRNRSLIAITSKAEQWGNTKNALEKAKLRNTGRSY